MEIILTFLLCSAYLFEGVDRRGRSGRCCAAVVGVTRVVVGSLKFLLCGNNLLLQQHLKQCFVIVTKPEANLLLVRLTVQSKAVIVV